MNIHQTDIHIHRYKCTSISLDMHIYLTDKQINVCIADKQIDMHLFLCIRMSVYKNIHWVGPHTILTNQLRQLGAVSRLLVSSLQCYLLLSIFAVWPFLKSILVSCVLFVHTPILSHRITYACCAIAITISNCSTCVTCFVFVYYSVFCNASCATGIGSCTWTQCPLWSWHSTFIY